MGREGDGGKGWVAGGGVNFRSPRQRVVNGVCLLDKAN